ncbi:hypothetical protein OSB04_011945 [Centaurea solstitialis]|uniref:CCHC-type domain-containing protein n=1 Tax=Centaurea solstitialis TaxID=347529 RepID=A0AA38WQE2_9ASTR|nr:hypothetical protein OSB04_011945 [Centaurea solstitialis]
MKWINDDLAKYLRFMEAFPKTPSECGLPKAFRKVLPNVAFRIPSKDLPKSPSECGSNFESIRVINFVASFMENGTISKPPRFNPSNFSLWKSRMMLFMDGIDSRYLTILRDGPLIPRVWDRFKKDKNGSSSDEDRSCASGRYILKSEKKYTDEDWKLVSLDTKVRTIIAMFLPDEVYHSLVNFSTAKEMWSTLCVMYEGSNEVKKSKKITLVRKYEFFSHEKGESLTNYYNRFNSLLNDLLLLNKVYDNEEMLNKFMDGLPEFWENICTCIKTSKDLETMPLSVLFGTLVNYEQTKLQRKSLFNDIKSSSIAFMSKNSKSVCTPQISYPSSDPENADSKNSFYPSEEYLSDADDEGGESSVDQVTDGMAKIDGFFKRPNSQNFKHLTQRKSFSKTGHFNKNEYTCFSCGKKGHFSSECRYSHYPIRRSSFSHHRPSRSGLQPSEGSDKSSSGRFERSSFGRYNRSVSSSNTDQVEKYKAKYLCEMELIKARKGKGLMDKFHDLADETTSESEKDTANTCLMAKDEPSLESTTKALIAIEKPSSSQIILPHKI